MARERVRGVAAPAPLSVGERITLPRSDTARDGEWNRHHSLRVVPPAWASHCPLPWEIAFAPAERPWVFIATDERSADACDDFVARYSADRECAHMNLPEEGCPEGCFAKDGSRSVDK
jgi:hypothetical protein